MLSEEVPHLQASFDPTVVFGGVTQYIVWMVICWIITLVLILVVGRKLTLIPTNKFVNTVEYGYQFVRNDMGEGIIGHGFKKHVPFLATLFFFILISNFVGLIPGCKTPTGTISVTWALATISFIYFNVWGIKAKGGLTYLKSFAPAGLPKVMVPIIWFLELISTCIRWLTLAVRLYGNMFAGHMIPSAACCRCPGSCCSSPCTPWRRWWRSFRPTCSRCSPRSTSRSPRAPTRNRSRAPRHAPAHPGSPRPHPPSGLSRLLQSRKP